MRRHVAKAATSPTPPQPVAAAVVTGVPEELRQELVSNITRTSSEWVSQVGQMQRFDVEFARRLTCCAKPSEAVALCSEWMAHRVDSAVAMQHRLLELWLDAVTTATRQKVEANGAGGRPATTSPAKWRP
jgi:hypothetical protein